MKNDPELASRKGITPFRPLSVFIPYACLITRYERMSRLPCSDHPVTVCLSVESFKKHAPKCLTSCSYT
jgi:hypothetical protein